MRETSLQTLRSVRKEWAKVLQVPEQRSPAALGADHGEGAVHLQSMKVHGGAEIHLQHMEEPHIRAGGCPEEAFDTVENQCWNRLLAGPVDLWRLKPMQKQVCWQDL